MHNKSRKKVFIGGIVIGLLIGCILGGYTVAIIAGKIIIDYTQKYPIPTQSVIHK